MKLNTIEHYTPITNMQVKWVIVIEYEEPYIVDKRF